MLAPIVLISTLAALAFLSLAFAFRNDIKAAMRPPQRIPVPVRVDEEFPRRRS
jgi:hypothetical protein